MQDKVLQQQLEIVIEQLNKDHPTMRGFAGTVQQAIKKIEELESRLAKLQSFHDDILAASEREDDTEDLYQLHIEVGHIIDGFDKMDCAIASEPVLEKDWTIIHDEHGMFWF